MAKDKIVCDSSAGLTDEEIKNMTLQLYHWCNDRWTVYVERETITNEQFP